MLKERKRHHHQRDDNRLTVRQNISFKRGNKVVVFEFFFIAYSSFYTRHSKNVNE